MIEADFLQDWYANKALLTPISVESIDVHHERKLMALKSAKLKKECKPRSTNQLSNIRERRHQEIVETTNILEASKKFSRPSDQHKNSRPIDTPNQTVGHGKILPQGRTRRGKLK